MMLALFLLTSGLTVVTVTGNPLPACPTSPEEWDAYTIDISDGGDPQEKRNALIYDTDVYEGKGKFEDKPYYWQFYQTKYGACAVRLLILNNTNAYNPSVITLYEDFRAEPQAGECKKDGDGNVIMGCNAYEGFAPKIVVWGIDGHKGRRELPVISGFTCCFATEWYTTTNMIKARQKIQDLRRQLVLRRSGDGHNWEVGTDQDIIHMLLSTPPPTEEDPEVLGLGLGAIIGISVGILIVLLLVIATLVLVFRKPPKPQTIAIAEGASQTAAFDAGLNSNDNLSLVSAV